MFIQTHQLDEKQLLDLDSLCALCKKTDGNIVAVYRHLIEKYRTRPANILYYEETMVGFLAAFFFQEKQCELALMVDPKYRQKKIATDLFKSIRPLLEQEAIDTLVFSSPHGLNNAWFLSKNLQYQHSEYHMLRVSNTPIKNNLLNLSIRLATMNDINYLCEIDDACFENQSPDMLNRFYQVLHDSNQCIFVIEHNHALIGKAHINWQDNGARLTDIAVIPAYQGRKFGQNLLAYCINYVLSMNKCIIHLDVETHNKHALGLYTRLGFHISNATDYWQMQAFDLTAFLKPI